MADLEQRLRSTVMRKSEAYEPSPDLPERIETRVRWRRRQRRMVTGGFAAAAVAAAVAIVVLAGPGRRDEGSIRMTNPDRPDVQEPDGTTTTPPTTVSTTTTTPSRGPASTAPTTTLPEAPDSPGIDPLTEQTRRGVGPITAGMTLRQAQDAAGVTITPVSVGSNTCMEAEIEGISAGGLFLVVEPTGGDPMDGIVRATAGSVVPTEEGAMVGQSRDELVAALGQPTRTEDRSAQMAPAQAELLVFESGGYAYGVMVVDDMVYGVQSGDPAWIDEVDGCPGSGPGPG